MFEFVIRIRVETHTATWANMTARCCLHEMDHLEGVVFTSKVSKLRLEMAVPGLSFVCSKQAFMVEKAAFFKDRHS